MEKWLELVPVVLPVVLGIALHFYRQFRGDKAAKEIAAFDLATKLAYDGVRNLAALYPGKNIDKASRGLQLFREAFEVEMGRAPTAAESKSALLHFDAAHAAEAEAKLSAESKAAPSVP